MSSVLPNSGSAGSQEGLQGELAALRQKAEKAQALIGNPRTGGQAADGGVKAIVGPGGTVEAVRISDEAYQKLGPSKLAQSVVVAISRAQQANLEKYRAALAELGEVGAAAQLDERFKIPKERLEEPKDDKDAVQYKTLGR
jgi:DNA-binding protein YbaB